MSKEIYCICLVAIHPVSKHQKLDTGIVMSRSWVNVLSSVNAHDDNVSDRCSSTNALRDSMQIKTADMDQLKICKAWALVMPPAAAMCILIE